LANIVAAMQAGITQFDSAIGGLGGCPYVPNAAENIATEDLVNMLDEMGVETGVDLDALLDAAEIVGEVIPHPLNSALRRSGKTWILAKAPESQLKIG
jgi:hydroxymethylglutaryl-CoA lyase